MKGKCFICNRDAPIFLEDEEYELIEHLIMENYICMDCASVLQPLVKTLWDLGIVPMLVKREKSRYVNASVKGKYGLSYNVTESAANLREDILKELAEEGVAEKTITMQQLLHFADEIIGESLMGGQYLPEGNQATTLLDAILYIIVGRATMDDTEMEMHY